VLWVVVVFVVWCRVELAVLVEVNVSVLVEGTSAANAVNPHMATTPASHAVCADDSVAELLETIVIDHGNPPLRMPPAVCRYVGMVLPLVAAPRSDADATAAARP
jgi:hypothetical protein